MNARLLFCLLWLAPLLCQGASFTSYFYNVEAITNVTARSAVRGLTGVFTNGITSGASTFTGVVGFVDGSLANPGMQFASATNYGIFLQGAADMRVSVAGTAIARFVSGSQARVNTPRVSLGAVGTDSVFLEGEATSVVQIGLDSATPAAQTLKGPDGSGSNIAGGAIRHDGGYSTGTAAGGPVVIRTANSAGATSSSLNTASERFHAIAKWVTLTSATATTIFTIPVPATNYVGLTATVTIYATDGTDHQSKTSVITVDAIAKTTTITPTISQVDNTTAASAGTLTCTYTAVDNTSNVLAVKADANSSLSETVLRAKIVITAINASGTGLVSEQ